MQPPRSKATAILATILVVANGCAHENMARPPSAEDIARINSLAESGGMRIEPVVSLPCAGGSCGAPLAEATRIESWDDRQISLWTEDVEGRTLPSEVVGSISVRDRVRGAAVGTAVGVGWALFAVAGLFLLAGALPADPGAPSTSSCDNLCVAGDMTKLFLPFVALGTVIGYGVGARRTFHFDDAGR